MGDLEGQGDRLYVGVSEVLGADLDELVGVDGRRGRKIGRLSGENGNFHACRSTSGLVIHRNRADGDGRLGKHELRVSLLSQLGFLCLKLLDFQAGWHFHQGRTVGTPPASCGRESERHKYREQPPPHVTPGDIVSVA